MKKDASLTARIITGLILFLVTAAAILLRGYYLLAYVWLFIIVGTYELCRVLKAAGRRISFAYTLISVVVIASLYYWATPVAAVIALVLCAMVGLTGLVFRREQPDLGDILAAVFPLVYPLLPILLLLGMCKLPQPYDLVGWVLTLLSSVAVDMFAYIFGRLLGKRKLCPHISPNKTIAGAVGGLVSGIAVMVAAGWVCRLLGVSLPWWFILAAAVLCCVAAQLGDLIASMIKRACGVKDFGTILPGHGGVLDRVDSYLFVGTVLYALISFII